MSAPILPAQFSELESHGNWILATETERRKKRMSSSMDELRAFYDAMFPHLDDALSYLNKFELHAMPAEAKRLLLMAISLTEVAIAVEVIRHPGVPDGVDPDRLVPVHSW